MASKKLSDPQIKVIKRLYKAVNHNLPSEYVPHNTGRSLAKMGYVVQLRDFSWSLTPDGLQLAESLFGSPDPDPTSAPVADDDADTVADEPVTPHKAGDIVDVCGVMLEAQENGLLKPLPPVADTDTPLARFVVINMGIDTDNAEFDTVEDVAAYLRELEVHGENVNDYLIDEWTPARTFGMQSLVSALHGENWLAEYTPVFYREDNIWQRENTKFNNTHVFKFADINGYKLPQSRTIAPNFNLGANKVLQGVRLQNMAKGGKKSDTRKAMTARQLGRLLKASPISRKPKPRSPLQIQRDLMFLDWIAGGQSPVQIVSRIETPLTGQVRRIA